MSWSFFSYIKDNIFYLQYFLNGWDNFFFTKQLIDQENFSWTISAESNRQKKNNFISLALNHHPNRTYYKYDKSKNLSPNKRGLIFHAQTPAKESFISLPETSPPSWHRWLVYNNHFQLIYQKIGVVFPNIGGGLDVWVAWIPNDVKVISSLDCLR